MDMAHPKKLCRSSTEHIIGGVAGGMAEYFKVDPLVVRIVFIIIALVSQIAPAVIAYLIAMIFIPKREGERKTVEEKISRSSSFLGYFFIVAGLLIFFNRLLPWYHISFVNVWAFALILFGIYLIFKRKH